MYYPAFLALKGRRCVVVGGGTVAERKVQALLEAGAQVVVVGPEATSELAAVVGQVELVARPYQEGDLEGAFLAIAATDDPLVNQTVVEEARRRQVLVNVVDDPARCDFIVPAVLRRGELTVAVSTGGRSPALARRVREDLELLLGPEYGELLGLLSGLRKELRQVGHKVSADRWQQVAREGLAALLEGRAASEVRARLRAALQQPK